MAKNMVEKRTWKEFRDSGLLWFVNRIIHVFGWALVLEVDEDDNDKVTKVYPARVKFRGFNEKTESKNFIAMSKLMVNNAKDLLEEARL
jgi:hypothetical protein